MIQNGDADEQMEVAAGQLRPQHLPQAHNVRKRELSLEQNQQPSKREEHIIRIVTL